MDAVISSVGLVGKAGNKTSWDVDYAANRDLLEEAVRAGVGKFVYTSGVRGPALEKLQLVRAKRAFPNSFPRGAARCSPGTRSRSAVSTAPAISAVAETRVSG